MKVYICHKSGKVAVMLCCQGVGVGCWLIAGNGVIVGSDVTVGKPPGKAVFVAGTTGFSEIPGVLVGVGIIVCTGVAVNVAVAIAAIVVALGIAVGTMGGKGVIVGATVSV